MRTSALQYLRSRYPDLRRRIVFDFRWKRRVPRLADAWMLPRCLRVAVIVDFVRASSLTAWVSRMFEMSQVQWRCLVVEKRMQVVAHCHHAIVLRQFVLYEMLQLEEPAVFFFSIKNWRASTFHLQQSSVGSSRTVVDSSQPLIGLSQPGAPSVVASHTQLWQRPIVTSLV
jgi:hypothetical protein